MSLFVAQHRRPPEVCPAWSGPLLLAHVSAAHAAQYGVTIQAEAVLDGEHRLILIVEATERERVEAFMSGFAHLGEVQVFPASSSEQAVERGGCGVR